jgi:hypothetical protein
LIHFGRQQATSGNPLEGLVAIETRPRLVQFDEECVPAGEHLGEVLAPAFRGFPGQMAFRLKKITLKSTQILGATKTRFRA